MQRADNVRRFRTNILKDDFQDEEGDSLEDESDSSSLSVPNEHIDFDLVYALHTFLATVEGQTNVTKGDSLLLMDDSNTYWWLVRVLKTQEVGYVPADNIENPYERLGRLNKHRNVDISAATPEEQTFDPIAHREHRAHLASQQHHPLHPSHPSNVRKRSVSFRGLSTRHHYPAGVWDEEEELGWEQAYDGYDTGVDQPLNDEEDYWDSEFEDDWDEIRVSGQSFAARQNGTRPLILQEQQTQRQQQYNEASPPKVFDLAALGIHETRKISATPPIAREGGNDERAPGMDSGELSVPRLPSALLAQQENERKSGLYSGRFYRDVQWKPVEGGTPKGGITPSKTSEKEAQSAQKPEKAEEGKNWKKGSIFRGLFGGRKEKGRAGEKGAAGAAHWKRSEEHHEPAGLVATNERGRPGGRMETGHSTRPPGQGQGVSSTESHGKQEQGIRVRRLARAPQDAYQGQIEIAPKNTAPQPSYGLQAESEVLHIVPELSVIRIFAGLNLSTGATFKTVLLNSSTTASDLVKQALQRFRVAAGEDSADYYLTVKSQFKGTLTTLQPHEKPLVVFGEMMDEMAETLPTIRRSSISSISSLISNLSMHPAIRQLPTSDFGDNSVKFHLNRYIADGDEKDGTRMHGKESEELGPEGGRHRSILSMGTTTDEDSFGDGMSALAPTNQSAERGIAPSLEDSSGASEEGIAALPVLAISDPGDDAEVDKVYDWNKGTSEDQQEKPGPNLETLMQTRIPLDLTGQVVVSDYRRPAHGGLAVVYPGLWNDRPVAVKLLKFQKDGGADAYWDVSNERRVRREIHVWAALKHPNITEFLGYSTDLADFPAMISRWCERGTVLEHLKRQALSVNQRMKLAQDVSRGLEYLHQLKVVHGDVKPANILVDDECLAKLCDFGLVRLVDWGGPAGMTTTSPYTGTERYKAPELFVTAENRRPVATFAGDTYSLGCIMLEFIERIYPFQRFTKTYELRDAIMDGYAPALRSETTHALIDLTHNFWNLLEACWAEPPDRPSTTVIVDALDNFARTMPGSP